jgi:hypothetical protein
MLSYCEKVFSILLEVQQTCLPDQNGLKGIAVTGNTIGTPLTMAFIIPPFARTKNAAF